jgi:hypothetical protein
LKAVLSLADKADGGFFLITVLLSPDLGSLCGRQEKEEVSEAGF